MDSWVLGSWTQHAGTAADAGELLAQLTAGSLPEAFNRTAVTAPHRIALRIDDDEVTHAGLDDAAARIAGWLRGRSVGSGDRVLITGGNSVAFVRAYLGALRAGATVVPASPLLTEPELRQLSAQARVKVAFADQVQAGRLRGAGTTPIVGLGQAASRGELTLGTVLADGDPVPPSPVDPGSPAVLAFTTGTTGTPKGVLLSHRNLLASIRSAMLAWRWSADDVLVHALPLTHQHGLGGVHATLLAGSRAVIGSRFEPAQLARLASEVHATVLFAVPAMYQRLVELTAAELAPFRRLRLAVSGSAPLPAELSGRIASAFGQLPLERYGTTESGLDVSNPYEGPRVAGSVGRPLPGVELRIADQSGCPRPDGEQGEILLKGPQVFGGYLGPAALTAEAFHAGGWFRTGDLGRIDPASGYVEITGRIKELIISGGLNVTPREVELVLEQHPAVREAAVGGIPSKRWGEEVAAWVVPVTGVPVDPAGLVAHARARLAAYKCPKRVFIVGSLPRNNLGKVLRRSLRPPARHPRPDDPPCMR
jgi:malonyl-CoA/methylmalonyl-CoA synthetase